MKKQKRTIVSDFSAELLDEISQKRHEILEDFSRAYLAETGLQPSQVRFVESIDIYHGEISWHFEPILHD